MEHGAEIAVGKWYPPECPFRIEYSTRVLDDIRLAVVDAFFSVPRGGAEIGGILLGKHEDGLISITDFEPLDCEHAMGPSFTLSARDQTLLAEMTAKAARNPRNRQALGWYHSHTRSEIFLSETDQDIHKRFFPEPWQVALVLKPHTFEPTRGGFFFRGASGLIRGTASYQEFVLDALPMRPAAINGVPAATHRPLHEAAFNGHTAVVPPEPPASRDSNGAAPVGEEKKRVPITREIPAVDSLGAPVPAPPAAQPPDDVVTLFQQRRQEHSWRAIKAAAWLALGLAAGALGYQTRESWLPQLSTKLRPLLPHEPDSSLTLSATDNKGQLNIHWDREAPAIRNALEGTLEIIDGNSSPKAIRLDGAHLATGAFSYGRESERVDVALIVSEPTGQPIKEQVSFLGKMPEQRGRIEDPDARKERDALSEKAEKLQQDYNSQAARTRKLEKDLKDMKDQLEKRSAPEAGKKEQ